MNNTNGGDLSSVEMGKLKSSLKQYKHLHQVAVAEKQQMQVKICRSVAVSTHESKFSAKLRHRMEKEKLKEMKSESRDSLMKSIPLHLVGRSPHPDQPKNVVRPKKRSATGAFLCPSTVIEVHPKPPSQENPQEAHVQLTSNLSSTLALSDDSGSEKEDEAPKFAVPVVSTTVSENDNRVFLSFFYTRQCESFLMTQVE